jgi:Zn-dependent protease with chaperone function
LLETLDDAEIEAVLAHELTHIRNGDVRMMVVAVIIAGMVSRLRRNCCIAGSPMGRRCAVRR